MTYTKLKNIFQALKHDHPEEEISMLIFNEPMPDCVPELYRSRQEAEDRKSELEMQRQAHYQANRKKLNDAAAAGLPILDYSGYEACWECPDADHDTMTDDDMCRVICRHPACPHHRKEESQ